jgi:RNA polymerase sigma factor (sigma-70 family)
LRTTHHLFAIFNVKIKLYLQNCPRHSYGTIIDLIMQGDQQVLKQVYRNHRQSLLRYVIEHNGSLQDAQDVYQEVMIAFYVNVVSGRLTRIHGKLHTYLYKLTQNIWHSRLRIHEPLVGASDLTDYPVQPSPNIALEDALLQQLMNQLDERCRQILTLYYFEGIPMQHVADRLGLSCAESARKRKCDCLSKLKGLAKQYRQSISDGEGLPYI